ncbi:hypothetical protein [Bdellovibrio sp. HCB209]|uniref:hypothetical protein n=1 Tax=Bdellovibrio sp. HCB209 TaxID=3394354 RepID=UPI0039B4334E
MKWPQSQRYFEGFRIFTFVSSMLLVIDQIFIRWRMDGEINVVSIAGWLPENIMTSHTLFQYVSWCFVACMALWLFKIVPRIASVLSIFLFILSTSLYLQNEPFGDHRQSVFCLLLILFAAREYKLIQHYFYQVAAGIIVSFYFLAGWEKVFYSGLSWINGTSLQIFVHYMGYRNSHLRELILSNVDIAKFFQTAILIFECGSFMLLGPKPLRWIWICTLIGFHVGIEEIFGYRYFLHLFAVLYLFALPDIMELKNGKNT